MTHARRIGFLATLCFVMMGCSDDAGRELSANNGTNAPDTVFGEADGMDGRVDDDFPDDVENFEDPGTIAPTTSGGELRLLGFSSGQMNASRQGYELRAVTGTPFEVQTLDAATGDWRLQTGIFIQ